MAQIPNRARKSTLMSMQLLTLDRFVRVDILPCSSIVEESLEDNRSR